MRKKMLAGCLLGGFLCSIVTAGMANAGCAEQIDEKAKVLPPRDSSAPSYIDNQRLDEIYALLAEAKRLCDNGDVAGSGSLISRINEILASNWGAI